MQELKNCDFVECLNVNRHVTYRRVVDKCLAFGLTNRQSHEIAEKFVLGKSFDDTAVSKYITKHDWF